MVFFTPRGLQSFCFSLIKNDSLKPGKSWQQVQIRSTKYKAVNKESKQIIKYKTHNCRFFHDCNTIVYSPPKQHKNQNRIGLRPSGTGFHKSKICRRKGRYACARKGDRCVNRTFINLSCIPRAVEHGSAKSEGFN